MSIRMQKTARGKRPQYFDDISIDRCLSMVMALSEEVWVMRERMAAMEALLSRGERVSSSVLDAYEPSSDESIDTARRREIFLDCVLRSIQQEVESLQSSREDIDMDEVIAKVAVRA